jgi:iron complex outermembrane receptor protein
MQGRHLAVIAATASLVVSAGLSAQETGGKKAEPVEELIIVTATKRSTTIQEVPFSINAQTEEDIERSGAETIEDLAQNVAGLTIQNLGPGQSQVAVRGVSAGQIVRDQPGVKEQVGVYLDESVISVSLFTPDLDLFDLNRVETLRGPQGTLFGSGSVGGTVRFITNQPLLGVTEGIFEADANMVEDGDAGGYLKGAFNVPLGESAALRAVAYSTQYGGFIDALREDGSIDEAVNEGTRTGARVALRFEPNENVAFTPRIVYQTIETDGFNRQEVYNLFANPFTTTRPPVTFEERQQFLLLDEAFEDDTTLADLTIEAGLGSVDLTSVTSYIERDILVSRDASALTGSVSVDFGMPDSAVLLPSNLRDTTDLEQITQEVRLSSNTAGSWQWLIGGFYSHVDRFYRQRLPTPGYDAALDEALAGGLDVALGLPPGTVSADLANGFPSDSPYNADLPYDIEQWALFGEASYDVNEALTLTAGARWYDFSEERTISQGGIFSAGFSNVRDETSSDGITPRFLLSYDVNDSVTFNAQVAQGFRLGGVNDPLNVPLCTDEDEAIFGGFQTYEDETLWNYEAGVKTQAGDNITLNAAVFHADIDDLQVTLDAGSCSSRISFNVPKAHSTGAEFELSMQPNDNWLFSLAGSVVDAKLDSTVRDGTGAILAGLESGNRLPSVPESQFATAVTYMWPISLASGDAEGWVSFNARRIGSRFTQPSDQVSGAGDFVSGLPFGGATGNEVTSLDLELDAYATYNLLGGVDFGTWEIVGYVTNLSDENADLAFDRERGGRARLGFHTNTPRTIGLTFRYRYGG